MEPLALLAQTEPFDQLAPAILDQAASRADIAYFSQGSTILEAGAVPDALFVVVRGTVQGLINGQERARFGSGDLFDVESLLRHRGTYQLLAREDSVCVTLPRSCFIELLGASAEFADFCLEDIAERATNERTASRQDLADFMIATIGDAYIHPPLTVDATTSIHDAAVAMREHRATSLLVERNGAIGICSGTDLRDAVVIARRSPDDPVGDIASYELVSLEADDFLFNALLTMTRHSISRVVIRRDQQIAGVLEQVDLLSFLSSHTHLIAVQIERAATLEELATASRALVDVIEALHGKGVKLHYIGQLVSELNKKLFAKLFALLAPAELLANSCLIVMGSEGREEQILKTDQDNALILRDGYTHPDLSRITQAFTEALVSFGYPRCPGNIMVSNPFWTRSVSAFRDEIFDWIQRPGEDSFMHFAIFVDAMPVAGNAGLLDELRQYVFQQLQSNKPFFARFARATVSFETPLGFFANFVVEKGAHREELDLKKGGIFPLTHGIRSLALEHRIEATNTLERIELLRSRGVLEAQFAVELAEALTVLSTLRLKSGLQKARSNEAQNNYINPANLNKLERELLRDSFKIVNEFKKFISFHFKLNLIT